MSATVVVLEGPNGSGKTHVASLLNSHIPGSIVYRPFRASPLDEYERLRRAGIPANTHIDDFYAADAIRTLVQNGTTVILDRSLPSGLAYARARTRQSHSDIGISQSMQVAEDCVTLAQQEELDGWLKIWEQMLGARKLYVTMLVDWETGKKRTAARERWYPSYAEHDVLIHEFVRIHQLIREPRLLIDTAGLEKSVAMTVDLIFHNLKRLG